MVVARLIEIRTWQLLTETQDHDLTILFYRLNYNYYFLLKRYM
jgi:hypothetical protein